MTHTAKRIITQMKHDWDIGSIHNPQDLLLLGTATYTLGDKVRVFTVRNVVYDESQTPLYSIPTMLEKQYKSLVELYSDFPSYQDMLILDGDNYLKVYDKETADS